MVDGPNSNEAATLPGGGPTLVIHQPVPGLRVVAPQRWVQVVCSCPVRHGALSNTLPLPPVLRNIARRLAAGKPLHGIETDSTPSLPSPDGSSQA